MRPGGRFGMTFWGSPKRLGLMPYFVTVAVLSPPRHAEATISQGGTGRPGLAEAMVEDSGLRVDSRGAVTVWAEWPDLDIAVRALTAAGPSRPALENVGEQKFDEELRKALAPFDVTASGCGYPANSVTSPPLGLIFVGFMFDIKNEAYPNRQRSGPRMTRRPIA